MAKIEYEDSDYQEEGNPSTGSTLLTTSKFGTGKTTKVGKFLLTVLLVILIFCSGAVGGIGGVILLSSNDSVLAKKLGLSNLSIPTVTTQKIRVEESNAIIDAVSKVSSSVVSITLKSTAQDIFGRTYQTSGAGTGFIITSDGLILTNKHVVSDQSAAYTVVTMDGKVYDAKVQSLDPIYDLAVIKIEARNLPVVELGNSDELKVGQWVVAVGNALGQFSNTVTAGVISAKGRQISAATDNGGNSETLSNLLQTDAAINPGNSGGPLVNLAGQVIGIDTAVASGAQGIGFAIPINSAKTAIDSIKQTGRIVRPYLGVRYVEITPDVAKASSLTVDYGALIQRGSGLISQAVVSSSPADKAGLVENDIILEVNGVKIDQNNSLLSLIQQYKIGDVVTLKVLSKGDTKDVKVTLEESK
ncbi:MAG TPA: trypsin-like peptidase domain-containing protein [Patescibacteria group bacterium]|nr:trypsin-like peptidase domain-containing protein [Patescibacteria group bacterium]